MECHTPPVGLFARSIVQCPKIRRFFSHKYWAEQGSLPSLYLPNCEDFTLRRADCMSKISLYLPRVKILNLDADYDLKEITLLKRGHASHGEWNVPAEQQSDFCLSCENALLGKRAKESCQRRGATENTSASFQRARCRFCYSCLLFFSCHSCLLFFSCYSCLVFFSCYSCLVFYFLLFLLAFQWRRR